MYCIMHSAYMQDSRMTHDLDTCPRRDPQVMMHKTHHTSRLDLHTHNLIRSLEKMVRT